MSTDELYKEIVEDFKKTGSVKQTATNVGTSLVRAQRVLITEGMWSSPTSEKVRELWDQGKSTQEIADELFLSIKTVQAYLPYTKGYYGSDASPEAKKSRSYREHKKNASRKQVHRTNREEQDMRGTVTPLNKGFEEYMKPSPVYRLRLDLTFSELDDAERYILNRFGKAEKGITRDILIPSNLTFHQLHYAIQRAFGWENSHLHHFKLTDKVFNRLTGGSAPQKGNPDSIHDGNIMNWAPYCGTYFRFPSEECDDHYWDDDYNGSVSIRTWLKRKYNTPCIYNGMEEHFIIARKRWEDLYSQVDKVPEPWKPSFAREKKKPELIPFKEADIHTIECALSDCTEILERLPVDGVLSPVFKKLPGKKEINALLKNRERRYEEPLRRYRFMDDIVYLPDGLVPWEGDHDPILPIAHEIIYEYDYGDSWEVKITCEEVYDIRDASKVYDHDNNEINDELKDKILDVSTTKKLTCIAADGLNVMDDVGGVYGYLEFLLALHSGEPEEMDDNRNWAAFQGWTGRKIKPENIL